MDNLRRRTLCTLQEAMSNGVELTTDSVNTYIKGLYIPFYTMNLSGGYSKNKIASFLLIPRQIIDTEHSANYVYSGVTSTDRTTNIDRYTYIDYINTVNSNSIYYMTIGALESGVGCAIESSPGGKSPAYDNDDMCFYFPFVTSCLVNKNGSSDYTYSIAKTPDVFAGDNNLYYLYINLEDFAILSGRQSDSYYYVIALVDLKIYSVYRDMNNAGNSTKLPVPIYYVPA